MSSSQRRMQNALVISGGGAYGAWGGGLLQHLTKSGETTYDAIIGNSTGSLMAPMVALGDYGRLRRAYTSVTQSNIFNVNPFRDNGKPKYWLLGWRAIRGKKTLGESDPLLEVIRRFFTRDDLAKIQSLGIDLVVAVYNLSKGQAEFKRLQDYDYDTAVRWIWASANSPLFMSIATIQGEQFTDGGVAEHIPVRYLLEMEQAPRRVDLVIHREPDARPTQAITNVLTNLLYTFDALKLEVSKSDVRFLGRINRQSQINAYYMNFKPSFPPLQFAREPMERIWDKGANGSYILEKL